MPCAPWCGIIHQTKWPGLVLRQPPRLPSLPLPFTCCYQERQSIFHLLSVGNILWQSNNLFHIAFECLTMCLLREATKVHKPQGLASWSFWSCRSPLMSANSLRAAGCSSHWERLISGYEWILLSPTSNINWIISQHCRAQMCVWRYLRLGAHSFTGGGWNKFTVGCWPFQLSHDTHTRTRSLAISGWDCMICQRRPGSTCLAVFQRSLTWGEKIGGGTRNQTSWLELDWNKPPESKGHARLHCCVRASLLQPGINWRLPDEEPSYFCLLKKEQREQLWHHRRRTARSD